MWTPSPGLPRLIRTPAAGHPLPQGGEGQGLETQGPRRKARVAQGLVCKSLTHVTEWVGFVVRCG
jgi:hypothetical protein